MAANYKAQRGLDVEDCKLYDDTEFLGHLFCADLLR